MTKTTTKKTIIKNAKSAVKPKPKSKIKAKTVSKAVYKTASKKSQGKAGTAFVEKPLFGRLYAVFTLLVLGGTTLYWSILSARLQLSNADQLANSFLMERAATFRGASLPGAHSFFIKWPLFWLVEIFGASRNTFLALTVLTVLLTVGLFTFILFKLNPKPLVFGTVCLALASVLLLVPTFPATGALLPVNMAMLTTRNLEYVMFIGILLLLVRHPRLSSFYFWLAASGLALLMVSDKLFLSLSLAASLMALIVYSVLRQWQLVSRAVHWVVASAIGAVGAVVLTWVLNATNLTHIASQSETGPYGIVHGFGSIVMASIYTGLGLLTNLGANPAVNTTVLRQYPSHAVHGLLGASGLAYVLNLILVVGGLYMVYRLLVPTLRYVRREPVKLEESSVLAILMVWATVAAVGVYIATDHYYAGDARYLTIGFFTMFVVAAAFLKGKKIPAKQSLLTGGVLLAGIAVGLVASHLDYHSNQQVLQPIDQRNKRVVDVLGQHPVDVLIGDYWRVLPIKLQSRNNIKIMPLAGCTEQRGTLTSSVWRQNLSEHSFAYILSLDKGLTNFPACTLSQAVKAYGRPNASALVAGTLDNPKEKVLFYDLGAFKSAPTTPPRPQGPSTVVPITTEELPNTSCASPTIMTVVAHQDDDLLFTSPDLIQAIKDGNCVRTVYITAGDDGQGERYWLGREKGSQAAYNAMINFSGIWIQRIVKLNNGQYITVASPRGNKKISLIFMHLPDGNVHGQGFSASHKESLERLDNGGISNIHTIDGQSTYSKTQLTAGLEELLATYNPTEIHTQANLVSSQYADHSDHMVVGRFTKKAYAEYERLQFANKVIIPIKFYVGYPIHAFTANVVGTDLSSKETAFFAYAKFDDGVCGSKDSCYKSSTVYGNYLGRQYTNPY